MEVTLRTSNGDIVVVVTIEHTQELPPLFDGAQGRRRTSWSEHRFAQALDAAASVKATSSADLTESALPETPRR